MNIKSKIVFAAIVLLITLVWVVVCIPRVKNISKNFSYTATIVSLDNFYDEANERFIGEQRSVTKFTYQVIDSKDGVLAVKNIFDVRKVNGEKIFSVERLYGIDSSTRKHVVGYGDRDRDGYLFAPKNLVKGQPFTYWHVNYDGPATMSFVREENISGLLVYRYETNYKGVRIDQTQNLGNLPNVGTTRGVELEPFLELWVEPITGRLIKYKDETTAYYYDLKTGQRLHPWNRFGNAFTAESVLEQVEIAKKEKVLFLLVSTIIPGLLLLFIGIIGLFHYRGSKVFKPVLFSILGLAVLAGVGVWFIPKFILPTLYPKPLEEIRLGVSKAAPELSALIYIAENQNYFKDEGLNVVQVPEENGIVAQQNANKGVTDIATTVEFAFVSDSFSSESLKILATINRSKLVEIIGRRDKGIDTAFDLKGKKIGVVPKSASEFGMGKFLISNNVSLSEVTVVPLTFAEIKNAIVTGKVDAVAVNDPFAYQIQAELGDNSVSWSAHTNKGVYWLVVSSDDYIAAHPQAVERFLKALIKAEEFVKLKPEESKNVVKNKLMFEQKYLDRAWAQNSFGVSLEQGLLISMEDQALWRISNKLTDKIAIPNFVDLVYPEALRKIKIDAVTLY